MILDRIVDSIRAAAGSLPVLAAVFRKKVRHLLPYPGEVLAIGFRGDTQDVPGDPAVHPEHGAQDKDTAALRVQTLEHYIRAGQLQFLSQDGPLYILGQVGHILNFPIADVVSVELEAQGELGEHVLLIVFEMVHRNAEYPGCEAALPFEGREVGHDLQQNVLGRVLCIMERAQHPQGQIEYQILYTGQYRFQRGFISGGGLLD